MGISRSGVVGHTREVPSTAVAALALDQSLHSLIPHSVLAFVLLGIALERISSSLESLTGAANLPLAVAIFSLSLEY